MIALFLALLQYLLQYLPHFPSQRLCLPHFPGQRLWTQFTVEDMSSPVGRKDNKEVGWVRSRNNTLSPSSSSSSLSSVSSSTRDSVWFGVAKALVEEGVPSYWCCRCKRSCCRYERKKYKAENQAAVRWWNARHIHRICQIFCDVVFCNTRTYSEIPNNTEVEQGPAWLCDLTTHYFFFFLFLMLHIIFLLFIILTKHPDHIRFNLTNDFVYCDVLEVSTKFLQLLDAADAKSAVADMRERNIKQKTMLRCDGILGSLANFSTTKCLLRQKYSSELSNISWYRILQYENLLGDTFQHRCNRTHPSHDSLLSLLLADHLPLFYHSHALMPTATPPTPKDRPLAPHGRGRGRETSEYPKIKGK